MLFSAAAMSRNTLSGYIKYLLPLILYCISIFFISAMPFPPAPDFGTPWGDKIDHVGAYGIMMFLAFRGSRWLLREKTMQWQLGVALLFCFLYGASDEIHQYFVPNRFCDLADWLADATGALLGSIFIMATRRARVIWLLYRTAGAAGRRTVEHG